MSDPYQKLRGLLQEALDALAAAAVDPELQQRISDALTRRPGGRGRKRVIDATDVQRRLDADESYEDIAADLNVTVNGLRMALWRAKKSDA